MLFDVGDTFVHFETSKARKFLFAAAEPAWNRLRELGYAPPAFPRYVRGLKYTALRELLWALLRRREAKLMQVLHARHRKWGIDLPPDSWMDVLTQCVPVVRQYFEADEEAVSVLSKIHATGIKMGIVSNTVFPAFAIDDVLEHDGLLEWFPVRVYSSDVGYKKPHPRIFETALERLGVSAERSVYVGDRIDKDVRGASRVGMKTVLMTRHGDPPSGKPRPDYSIRRLSELLPLVGA